MFKKPFFQAKQYPCSDTIAQATHVIQITCDLHLDDYFRQYVQN